MRKLFQGEATTGAINVRQFKMIKKKKHVKGNQGNEKRAGVRALVRS